ncbi:MAG: TatD family deoxyribonuclease [Proteobacteria bacterium]|nr:MAG: TatD family deoxyribonuclease [Pseudomonadota bacterium]
MELVDSHCHIDFEPLGDNVETVLDAALRNDVAYLLCVSVNMRDYPRVRELAENHERVFASVGVHPNECDEAETSVDELVAHSTHRRVVAIGETGLDYFRSTGDLDWQRDRFSRHIEAARQSGLPLIIHTRDAAEDTLRMMRENRADDSGGVMHCFSEDWTVAKQALDLGFYISFSGIVTFKSALALREVAKKTPLDRILVETDAPYLAPVPHRGKTNQPAFVRHTAQFVAELRQEPLEEFAAASTRNFFQLFGKARSSAYAVDH